MAHHQDAPSRLGGVHRTLRVGDGRGQRLLDKAVLAGFKHARGQLGVRGHGRGQHDRVELGVGEQLVDLGAGAHSREGVGQLRADLL